MAKHQYLLYAVLIIIVIAAVCLYYVLWSRKNQRQYENFENIDNDYLTSIYKDTGIERCHSVYADIVKSSELRYNMAEKAITPMDNFVLGYRIREWLPKDEKVKVSMSNDSKYCYILYDSNNNAIDPIFADGGKCSMENPLFQNSGFINNIFVDNTADVPHTLPYSKCVLDINTSAIDNANLSSFWIKTGEQQCSSYQGQKTREMNDYLRIYSNSNAEYAAYKDLDPKLNACLNTQSNLNAYLENVRYQYAFSNCAFANQMCESSFKLPSSNISTTMGYEQRRNQLQSDITSKAQTIRELDANISAMQQRTREDTRKYNDMNANYITMSNEYIRCSSVDFPEQSNLLLNISKELSNIYSECNILAKQYDQCRKNLTVKQGEYSNLVYNTNKARTAYQGSNINLVSCQTTNDFLRQNIATLKDQLQKFETQSNECASILVSRKAEANTLHTDVTSLTVERDDWLRRCTYDQKSMLDLSVQTINELRTASSTYTRANCGNDMTEAKEVNDLIQQKFKAMAVLNQPIQCSSREDTRSKCCKARGFE